MHIDIDVNVNFDVNVDVNINIGVDVDADVQISHVFRANRLTLNFNPQRVSNGALEFLLRFVNCNTNVSAN